jgi:hypothetical protein
VREVIELLSDFWFRLLALLAGTSFTYHDTSGGPTYTYHDV